MLFLFFVLGLIIGSFLNVVIYRLNTSKSLGGRSACMSCQNKLSWYELIPLLSFLGLKGRCQNCKTKISIQYPLVELLTGLIFAGLFLKLFQNNFFIFNFVFVFTFIYYAAMFSLLLVIAVYDLRHKIIPNNLALTFCVLSIFSSNAFIFAIFDGIFLALPFAFLWLVSKGTWIGLGDAKLVLGLGWFLGFSQALSAIMLAFWSGALVGLALLIFKKTSTGMKTEIPFAPFLIVGAFIAFIFNLRLFDINF